MYYPSIFNLRFVSFWAISVVAVICFSSCSSVNQLRYFKDLPDSALVHLPPMEQEPRIIQKGDRLQITIGAKNPEAAATFNNYGAMPTSGAMSQTGGVSAGAMNSDVMGFWVDEDGKIEYPIIGKIQAEGLTSKQLKDTLTQLVLPYLRDPLVNVKFLSFKFTVLGEVRAPGTFVLSQQRTTLLDALGAAGDLPRSAKRYNIQLYRDYNGKRVIASLDLRKKDLLNNAQLFQIKNNDVIIVQPRDVRLFNEEARTYISLLTLLLGTGALIISLTN